MPTKCICKRVAGNEWWEKEFNEKYPPIAIGYDGNERDYFRREWCLEFIKKIISQYEMEKDWAVSDATSRLH